MMRKALLATLAAGGLFIVVSCSAEPGSSPQGASAQAASKPAAAVTPAVLEHGRGLYKANCAACHGNGGKGDGPAAGVMKPPPRDHTDRAYMSTMSDEELGKVIQFGGAMKGKPLMPSNPQIKGNDLAALVAFTRSLSTGSPQQAGTD